MIFNILFAVFILLGSMIAFPNERDPFAVWLENLKVEARKENISENTIENTFKDAEYLPSVIELDRSQPEFISTFLSYLHKRVTESKIKEGRDRLSENQVLLDQIEKKYGVPKNILVAFWGLETNYGGYKGNYGLPSALMTLAYEGRRADFFRSQLLDMMRIVEQGHKRISDMQGSWAGAMGHMQFMPATFIAYAIDGDADGRSDIWNSLPDAFSSAANYLSSIGWKRDEPVAFEVKLPNDFEYEQAQLAVRQPSKTWASLGVLRADGTPLPPLDNTAVLLPQGWQGPAFLVASNFDAVMHWNRSIKYALSVSHLADQLVEDKPILYGANADNHGLALDEVRTIQAKLNALGFDSGLADGFPGTKTQQAIRSYQLQHHLPADGYPSYALLQQLINDNGDGK
ncbi:MAG: lytic murein transglycosylase [Methylophilaceae bacterium]|nr:lytic murein transglycosylase [Methylophilaceae bacterium]